MNYPHSGRRIGNRSWQVEDDAGQVTSTTDARGEKLVNIYDALGRKIETRDDTTSGALRSSWAYDTLAKGQLTSSTRHSGGVVLTTSVTGYDHHYRPSGQTVTVPTNTALPSGLTGSYTTEYTYTATGLPKTTYLQRAGNLLGETDHDLRLGEPAVPDDRRGRRRVRRRLGVLRVRGPALRRPGRQLVGGCPVDV